MTENQNIPVSKFTWAKIKEFWAWYEKTIKDLNETYAHRNPLTATSLSVLERQYDQIKNLTSKMLNNEDITEDLLKISYPTKQQEIYCKKSSSTLINEHRKKFDPVHQEGQRQKFLKYLGTSREQQMRTFFRKEGFSDRRIDQALSKLKEGLGVGGYEIHHKKNICLDYNDERNTFKNKDVNTLKNFIFMRKFEHGIDHYLNDPIVFKAKENRVEKFSIKTYPEGMICYSQLGQNTIMTDKNDKEYFSENESLETDYPLVFPKAKIKIRIKSFNGGNKIHCGPEEKDNPKRKENNNSYLQEVPDPSR